jgi:excinuclease ABC subunit A
LTISGHRSNSRQESDQPTTAGHVIDLGPDGGHAGGEVVAAGAPEDVAACRRSHTGRYLKAHLRA